MAQYFPESIVRDLIFFFHSVYSLTQNRPDSSSVFYRPIYEEIVISPTPTALMKSEEICEELVSVLEARKVEFAISNNIYWDTGQRYAFLRFFGAMVQFTDSHKASLPKHTFPPQADVCRFISIATTAPNPVNLAMQLEIALEITRNNLLGAIHLLWITTRFLARGADRRAYPDLPMNPTVLRKWNQQIPRFNVKESSGRNDGPGDTYYFWTQVFATILFSVDGFRAIFARFFFKHGTKIMTFVRNQVARKQPNMTTHEPASSLGIEFGLLLVTRASTPL